MYHTRTRRWIMNAMLTMSAEDWEQFQEWTKGFAVLRGKTVRAAGAAAPTNAKPRL